MLDESKRVRVRKGEVLAESGRGLGLKPDIAIPNGQVQHGVGAAFLQNATLDSVLPRLRNYNNRSRYMMPEIIASRLTDHHGDVFQVYLRLVEKAMMAAVLNIVFVVLYWEISIFDVLLMVIWPDWWILPSPSLRLRSPTEL